uniref:Uncharacterized protein n=1 Tax=Oryza sativa subsp. japonica TaxID=39947 RepID=Q7EYK6_ORYSJ|nr:hypothetical protein [Oryza sativa Japonica Group]
MGGLGILDLERFSSSLRLRWLWMRWQDQSRPWDKMELPCNDRDIQLFQACNKIQIGQITDVETIHELVQLGGLLSQIALTENEEDKTAGQGTTLEGILPKVHIVFSSLDHNRKQFFS